MEIKKGLHLSTSDFFYDLFDGGYLSPKKLCVSPSDMDRVYYAINTILEFREAVEEAYPNMLN